MRFQCRLKLFQLNWLIQHFLLSFKSIQGRVLCFQLRPVVKAPSFIGISSLTFNLKLFLALVLFITIIPMVYPQQLIQTFTGETTSNNFGYSVSDAGDINNDGYDDVIVGAYSYSSSTGRAYIFYGGSSLDATPDVIMTGQTTGDSFGSSVSGAGDINKDGFDDVIVGAGSYGSSTGRAYIYYGGVSMDNIADVTMTGEAASYFGGSVSGAGDVNGDGYDDVIIGASNYNTFTGRAYIYYGGVSIDVTPDIIMTGEGIYNFFGLSVSSATHLNNDIYSDVIVGAMGYNSNAGRAYIYFGSSSMDNIADVTFNGVASGDYLGCSVSGAGDVNNDAYSDVIVGAYGYSTTTGRAYIYFGGLSMDNTADITMTGEATGNLFGLSVAGAGDFNKDNFADVIVGAYGYSSNTGRAYIYYGGSSRNNTVDVTFNGVASGDYLGYSVSGAGDANNDTYSDVIVGAYGYSSNTGRAYISSDDSAPLPVELSSFSAVTLENGVKLNWRTETEVSNYGFDIERAYPNSKNLIWEKIGFAEGHGNSNSPKDYSFVDENVTGRKPTYRTGRYSYRLKQIDTDGKFEYSKIIEVDLGSPISYELSQNYPNPFNPSTTIRFSVIENRFVNLSVFNSLGEIVEELVKEVKEPGVHTIEFNADNLSSGTYIYRIQTTDFVQTKKMILLK